MVERKRDDGKDTRVEYLMRRVPAEEVSINPVVPELVKKAERDGVKLVWHRFLAQQPQCGFGLLGICCRNCNMGPCRIDPFGYGPDRGTCGATADTIVARNLIRMTAGGAAAHSDHGREVALVFKMMAEGKAPGYRITDIEKLKMVASRYGIKVEDRKPEEIAKDLADIILNDFGKQDEEPIKTLEAYAPEVRKRVWTRLGVMPRGIDREIVEIMHRTHIGVDADPLNLLLQGIRAALGDGFGGSLIATELQDILFGTPKPVKSVSNLGVLKEDTVNLIVHGHVPILSEKVVEAATSKKALAMARDVGAKGITVAGMCCTGNEVLMRRGIPPAGNFLMQELAVATGAVEAMVVDYQCIMPSLPDVAACYHTKIITTMPIAKIPGAVHIEFDPAKADEVAMEIVRTAIENFKNRSKEKVMIPKERMELVAGFSLEAIVKALGGTLEPLINALRDGTIKGIAGIVGCNNPKVKHNHSHVTIAKELIKNDVLVVGTGCWALAAGMAGLMRPEAVELAGDGLKKICNALKIPPCLHMGSCVDCTRILNAISALAEALNVDTPDLPVVGSAPEWMSEKAVSIGTYFVGHGVFTHLGTIPPVLGSPTVTKILTDDVERYIGGKFYVEPDPYKAARTLLDVIEEKRRKLHWPR